MGTCGFASPLSSGGSAARHDQIIREAVAAQRALESENGADMSSRNPLGLLLGRRLRSTGPSKPPAKKRLCYL